MSAEHAYHMRWHEQKDLGAIMSIEARSFDSSRACTKEELLCVLRDKNVIGMVAENPEGKVIGFMIYRIHRQHIELLRFAVTPERRRQGVGTVMMDRLKAKLGKFRNRLYVDVPERLLGFQCLLRACGVPAVDVQRGHDGDDDTFCFQYRFVPESKPEEIAA